MSKIRLLDCTLRDGGYCNDWIFGKNNIHKIIKGLLEANIDIIECGYISQKKEFNIDRTQYTSFKQIGEYIPQNREGKIFVGMINYGEYKKALDFFVNTPMNDLEKVEDIDHLRFLANGIDLHFNYVDSESISVDTPKDLEKVRNIIMSKIKNGEIILSEIGGGTKEYLKYDSITQLLLNKGASCIIKSVDVEN
ncbi:hypothetical protein ACTQWG_18480 [Blautia sp. HCP3S3_H10_1]|uniref:hypothetical protein n=1 Tax=unclassified Blautia TaxID=2648079 RepID=UPI003F92B2C6